MEKKKKGRSTKTNTVCRDYDYYILVSLDIWIPNTSSCITSFSFASFLCFIGRIMILSLFFYIPNISIPSSLLFPMRTKVAPSVHSKAIGVKIKIPINKEWMLKN